MLEILHLAARFERLVTGSAVGDLHPVDRTESRRLLRSLDAILRVHSSQEEELLASVPTDTGVDS